MSPFTCLIHNPGFGPEPGPANTGRGLFWCSSCEGSHLYLTELHLKDTLSCWTSRSRLWRLYRPRMFGQHHRRRADYTGHPRSFAARLTEPLHRRAIAQHPWSRVLGLGRPRNERAVPDSGADAHGADAMATPCAYRNGRRQSNRAAAGRPPLRASGVAAASLRPAHPGGAARRGMVGQHRAQSGWS